MKTNDDSRIDRRGLLRGLVPGGSAPPESHRCREFFVRDEDESHAATPEVEPAAAFGEPSRRDFVKTVGVVAATAAVATTSVGVAAGPPARRDIVAAIGDLLIPSAPGDPGYKDLEPYHITDEVMKALPGVGDAEATLWNETSKAKFGKTFLELTGEQRAQYARQVIDGSVSDDPKAVERLKRVFRNTRRRIVTLYYANFPEHEWPRDRNGMPILKPGDTHQITNPNTTKIVTGWDQSGFFGPLTWEEEERRRNLMKAIHWHEGWSPFDYVPEVPSLRGTKLS